MRVGILTYHFSNNFGAALQAYALRAWLLDQGHDASFINYCPEHVEKGSAFRWRLSKEAWRSNIKSLFLKAMAAKLKLTGDRGQGKKFAVFRDEFLDVTEGEAIVDAGDLQSGVGGFDAVICGSDQIWSSSAQYGVDPVFYLGFPKRGARHISYAASFGGSGAEVLKKTEAPELLNNLDGIAVRERSGVEIVKELTGRDAVQTLDPTCLPGSYERLTADIPARRDPYLFCYALRTSKGVREAAGFAADVLGVPVVSPANPHSRWRPIGTTCYPGPQEWVALIRDAGCVVTNSFHGTVFSILLKRPFVVVSLPGKKRRLSDRMTSLLSGLGLIDHFVESPSREKIVSLLQRDVNWEETERRLDSLREISADYLSRQLSASVGGCNR